MTPIQYPHVVKDGTIDRHECFTTSMLARNACKMIASIHRHNGLVDIFGKSPAILLAIPNLDINKTRLVMTRDELKSKLEEAKIRIQSELYELGEDADEFKAEMKEELLEQKENLKELRSNLKKKIAEFDAKSDEEIEELKEEMREKAEEAKQYLNNFVDRFRKRSS